MVDKIEVFGPDHKYGRDANGFPEDTKITWYSPDMIGNWDPQESTLWDLMQTASSFDTYLDGYREGEYVRLLQVNDTEYDEPPFNPEVWEVFLDNGRSFICCEHHKAMLINHKDEHQALHIGAYAGYNDTSIVRGRRVKLTPRFKAKFWMNLITENDQPYLGPGGIIHCSAKLV